MWALLEKAARAAGSDAAGAPATHNMRVLGATVLLMPVSLALAAAALQGLLQKIKECCFILA